MPKIAVSVHQPNFMPWLKLLDKILASDVYVAYDTVQYTKSEFHSRQKFKTHAGTTWLTVPTRNLGGRRRIADMQIDNTQPWRRKHLAKLRNDYGKAAYFDEVYALLQGVYGRGHTYLADLNLDLIDAVCRYLGTPVRIVRAVSLTHAGDNTERIIQLVRGVSADVHLTSTYGSERRYIDWDRVRAAGITVHSQVFEHPVYGQLWEGFVPNLAAVDMLFNCGPMTGKILEANRRFQVVEPAVLHHASARA
jgi:hypothetical protein